MGEKYHHLIVQIPFVIFYLYKYVSFFFSWSVLVGMELRAL